MLQYRKNPKKTRIIFILGWFLKKKNNRLLRVGENIRAVLSKSILSDEFYIQELKNTIVTITEVMPSKDLRYAKVYVSSVGGDEKKVAETLNNFANIFSKLVAKEISTKYSPKLSFYPDLSFEKADEINKLIKKNATK